ncbi:hypothetical protein ACLI1A_10275 [Flavobacterium sp. RHBU_3]|uniref:hypothetical protein n=1 Tax=Flavobacterium sp. RHBU_3 TaxID=3391184 RepID=UPI0039854403
MKQFFSIIMSWFVIRRGIPKMKNPPAPPQVKRNGKVIGTAVSVTVYKSKFLAFIDNTCQLNLELSKAATSNRKLVKAFRRQRLHAMYQETGLDYGSAHKLAARFKMSLRELADYYHYFGQLPRDEFRTVILNYGVPNLIAEFESLMENSGI